MEFSRLGVFILCFYFLVVIISAETLIGVEGQIGIDLIPTTTSSTSINNSNFTYYLNPDGNASSICSGDEVLLGDGTCYDSNEFYDGANIQCGDNEVLLGQDATLCVNLNDTIDDRAVSGSFDGNASSICADDQVLLGNGTCWTSSVFFDDTDTTYTAGSNMTLDGTEFSVDMVSIKAYFDLIYQTIANALTGATEFGGEVSGTYDAIVLDHDALDDQYLELTDLPLENETIIHCTNITGADADFCVDSEGSGADTNASTICSGTEVLLGNTTCYDSDVFFDDTDTTIGNCSADQSCDNVLYTTDYPMENLTLIHCTNITGTDDDFCIDDGGSGTPDGNASSICSGTEVLLGNGTCYDSDLFFDDTTIADTDTNASTICSGTEVLLGNTTCWDTSVFFDNTDSNLTEDDVEGYIFDADNTANLGLSGYNISAIDCIVFDSGGKICSGV